MIKVARISQKDALKTCKRYHYTKKVQGATHYFGVWDQEQYIGCVGLGYGASPLLGRREGFETNEICELLRVAFSGKQKHQTSMYIMKVIKLFKEKNKTIKAIYSFADTGQNHKGIIYQAMNFIYIGLRKGSTPKYKIGNKIYHAKTMTKERMKNAIKIPNTDKHLYILPLCRSARKKLNRIKKEYPKAEG